MTIAGQIAEFAASVDANRLPQRVRETLRLLLFDVAGLCLAARNTEYVRSACASVAGDGRSTAIGHAGGFGPYDAALINGTAAHGEDYDDTFEGGPVHAGAVIVPAILAAAEHRGLPGDAAMAGLAAGVEIMCRMSLVAPQATHKACFHPTAIFGAPAAAIGVGAALRLAPAQIANAIGIAGSLASGIIEYLADGSWTKRLHAGWAAQSGIRAALLAEGGFNGPATVLEGTHGFYKAFAPSKPPDFRPLLDGLGEDWVLETLAFKPYACGTMTQPYIDCAIALAKSGVRADDIVSIVCDTAEGYVHRLWEPLAQKHAPANGYAGKFSVPYCIAAGFTDGKAGFEQFTDERVADPALRALAAKVSYAVNPNDPYPKNFTGHIRATLKDGSVREVRKPHMRGGAHEPLPPDEIRAKFFDNARFGGWPRARIERLAQKLEEIAAGGAVDLALAREWGMGELEGSVAIVTGAARNIGRAIALELADAGAAVTLVTRSDVQGIESVAAEIKERGGRAFPVKADITRIDDVARMVEETAGKFGRIDILVNNAGLRPEGPFEELSLDEWHQVMAVILDGPFLCSQAALPHLEKSDGAAIVNIGGLTAYLGAARRAHVITAKAGLDGFTKALAVELAPKKITVNLVAPGLIETKRSGEEPAHRKTRTILAPRRGQPSDIAAMVRLLAGPNGRYITGQTIHINGGVYLP